MSNRFGAKQMGPFCYDFSKCTMISLAAVAISLTIGLVSIAYGKIAGLSPEHREFYKGYWNNIMRN